MEEEIGLEAPDHEFECQICYENFVLSEKFVNQACGTSHQHCKWCVVKHVETQIDEYNNSQVLYMDEEYRASIDFFGCCQLFPRSTQVKWSRILCQSMLVIEEAQFAYCPFPYYSELILNECDEDARAIIFPNCKQSFCYKCKLRVSSSHVCNQVAEHLEIGDIDLVCMAVENNWKRCPICKHFTERSVGCSEVKCRCGTKFCYGCGMKTCICQGDRRGRTLEIFVFLLIVGFVGLVVWLVWYAKE